MHASANHFVIVKENRVHPLSCHPINWINPVRQLHIQEWISIAYKSRYTYVFPNIVFQWVCWKMSHQCCSHVDLIMRQRILTEYGIYAPHLIVLMFAVPGAISIWWYLFCISEVVRNGNLVYDIYDIWKTGMTHNMDDRSYTYHK